MASLYKRPDGSKRIQFTAANNRRKTIYLGQVSNKTAEMIRTKVEAIHSARLAGYPLDRDTSKWLSDIGDELHGKLARVGLADERSGDRGHRLGELLEGAFSHLTVKPGTMTAYNHTRRNLAEHFGTDRTIQTITPMDADQFKIYLKDQGLSPATVSRRMVVARYVFRQAVRWEWINRNPFEGVKPGSQTNKARQHFVSREEVAKVLEQCPDAQWRLLVALSRYGGLRTPSEPLALRWSDVLWDKERIRIPSPKTEHHAGGDCRIIPIFPELKGPLLEVFEEAEPGAEYVITRYRDSSCNLRTQLMRFIQRAGLKVWPKLWHNMRASRETELAEQFPIQTVVAWIGNSVSVASQHYLQVTDEHFERATHNTTHKVAISTENSGEVRNEANPINPLLPDTYPSLPIPNKYLNGPDKIRTCDLVLIRDAL